jgi:hypothetical protein
MFSPIKKVDKMKDVKIGISDKGLLTTSVIRFNMSWEESFDFMNEYDTSIKSFKRSFSGDSYYYSVDVDKADDSEMVESFLLDVGVN